MSEHEQDVRVNLSESGVKPMTLAELTGGDTSDLLPLALNYPHVNGDPELRERIAALYSGATSEDVLVTVGAIEANYLTVNTLLARGDHIAVMSPNYMQIWGVAKNLGLNVSEFRLDPGSGWALDVESLHAACGPKTKLIAVCNPNNPTGHVLSDAEMEAIVAEADAVGAWILADEVYSGAERTGEERTPSMFGSYPKVIAVGSMSKAYGLPGLRIGWAVAPEHLIDEIWARHEYVAISASMISNKLASIALSDEVRPRIIERTRGFVRQGYPVLEEWVNGNAGLVSLVPPDAGAIALVKYEPEIPSVDLVDRLRIEKSVLIAPGAHFGAEGFIRISFGLPKDYLREGLKRIGELLSAVA